MSEKLGFENTANQWIRLLRRADTEWKPVVFERRCSNEFDSTNRDGPLGSYRQSLIHNWLKNNIHISSCLFVFLALKVDEGGPLLTRIKIRGLGLLDLPNLVTNKSQRQENSIRSWSYSSQSLCPKYQQSHLLLSFIESFIISPGPPLLPIPR